MSIELNWKEGSPSLIGLYFVAVKMGPAAGVYDFVQWNGSDWDILISGDIIGYVDIQELKNSLNIKWPESDNVPRARCQLPEDDSDLWTEV